MLKNRFIYLAALVALFLWLTETTLHVFVFKTGPFMEMLFPADDPDELWMRIIIAVIVLGAGFIAQRMADRITRAYEKEHEISTRLEASLREINLLQGILPICASCKKIRDDKGYWNQVEEYISEHSAARFSHGLCPECAKKLYPEFSDQIGERSKPDQPAE